MDTFCRFDIVLLEEAYQFLEKLDQTQRRRVFRKFRIASEYIDPKVFKKLNKDLWEFRINLRGNQLRFLSFWDKTSRENTLVVISHGFMKKQSKVPSSEMDKAMRIRQIYFNEKLVK